MPEFDGFGAPMTLNSNLFIQHFYRGGYSILTRSPTENEPGTTRSINEFVLDVPERP